MSWAVRYLNEPKWRAVNSGCNIELFCENLLSVMDGNFGKELGKMCLLGKWSRVESIFLLQCSVPDLQNVVISTTSGMPRTEATN